MRRSKGSQTISWIEHRTLWDGVSVALILRFYPERVETKRGNAAQGMVRPEASGDHAARLQQHDPHRECGYLKKLTPAQQAMFRKENAAAPDPSFEYYHRRWLSAGMSAEATG